MSVGQSPAILPTHPRITLVHVKTLSEPSSIIDRSPMISHQRSLLHIAMPSEPHPIAESMWSPTNALHMHEKCDPTPSLCRSPAISPTHLSRPLNQLYLTHENVILSPNLTHNAPHHSHPMPTPNHPTMGPKLQAKPKAATHAPPTDRHKQQASNADQQPAKCTCYNTKKDDNEDVDEGEEEEEDLGPWPDVEDEVVLKTKGSAGTRG
ncbi:hypothetical protein M413DRAFT_31105 [Hebeloma cylindrosporum]|uniref:Uncharacterized protein n=1 Tax=Hebeloma cylindrosporum TaxID=76867 RepID=A0A0C3BKD8_HEBCY|nr:hypothetical protein M413DRAFT_31105 [Hebeloma cylindrosporum h7]